MELIKRQLEGLLSVVELEADGAVAHVDGFRLKNLSDWLIPSSDDPGEILEYAASRCNCDCIMCYNKGNPPPHRPKKQQKKGNRRIQRNQGKAQLFFAC
ncbi:unnamed protein product [marine sediment metagenome]|uniref:Uncharacterized protein n=1 Tax=marine sediment metagenome TaxID=412755 RepID=X1GHS6_9ZZZZ